MDPMGYWLAFTGFKPSFMSLSCLCVCVSFKFTCREYFNWWISSTHWPIFWYRKPCLILSWCLLDFWTSNSMKLILPTFGLWNPQSKRNIWKQQLCLKSFRLNKWDWNSGSFFSQIPSLKLTYPLKIDPWKRRFLLETVVFRGQLFVLGSVGKTGKITLPGACFENNLIFQGYREFSSCVMDASCS